MVAPTRVTVPSSTTGRKPSCWARLKRWISSTNSSVPWPARGARCAPPRRPCFRSATPEKTAESCSKCSSGRLGQQPGDGGLADAGRAPEDHRGEPRRARACGRARRPGRAGGPGPTTSSSVLRPQPVGERPRRAPRRARRRSDAPAKRSLIRRIAHGRTGLRRLRSPSCQASATSSDLVSRSPSTRSPGRRRCHDVAAPQPQLGRRAAVGSTSARPRPA